MMMTGEIDGRVKKMVQKWLKRLRGGKKRRGRYHRRVVGGRVHPKDQ